MVRRSLSTPPDDPQYTDVAGEEQVKQEILRPDPGRHGPTHCGVCGKPLEAQLTCVACGDDDDVERDGPGADRSCLPSEGSSAPAGDPLAAARLAERPETWVRPDLNEALAEVFEGRDTGERRREDDAA